MHKWVLSLSLLFVVCLSFSFPLSDDVEWCQTKRGKQADLCGFSFSTATWLHNFLPSSGNSNSLATWTGKSLVAGISFLRCDLDWSYFGSLAQKQTCCAAWLWIQGVAATSLSEERPHRNRIYEAWIRFGQNRSVSWCHNLEKVMNFLYLLQY